jgi:uncharacterized membrane-anchored protein
VTDHDQVPLRSTLTRDWTRHGAVRVAEVTVAFWVIKALSTALGESTSDYLVHAMAPVAAVLLGFVAFVIALLIQLRTGRYVPWTYWLTVVMVGTFGTMAADVVHVAFGVPYAGSSVFYGATLALVFYAWWKVEGTLSIHTVDTTRRELFYWAAVVATFAMGTAVGDFTAYTLGLGYGVSIMLFAALMVIPLLGWRLAWWSPVLCFWFAYVLTRPLGASVADWLGKPTNAGGRGLGAGPVSLAFAVAIAASVAWLTVRERVPAPSAAVADEA